MRALWSDRPNCSHNVSQKVKRIRRVSDTTPKKSPRCSDFLQPLFAACLLFSTPNMTGRRFHRTMEMIPPAPGSLKALLFPPILDNVQTRDRKGYKRGTARNFLQSFPLFGTPVVQSYRPPIFDPFFLGAKRISANFLCTKFSENPSSHGRPRRKSWTSAPKVHFPAAPVMGRNPLTSGHPGVRVGNVCGKSGPKS